jgi:hypothetical protein
LPADLTHDNEEIREINGTKFRTVVMQACDFYVRDFVFHYTIDKRICIGRGTNDHALIIIVASTNYKKELDLDLDFFKNLFEWRDALITQKRLPENSKLVLLED